MILPSSPYSNHSTIFAMGLQAQKPFLDYVDLLFNIG